MNTAKPQRRWFQFSFRALLIVVALLSVLFAWLASEIQHAERQRKVVEWVRGEGGYVLYDYQRSQKSKGSSTRLPGRRLLRDYLDEGLFADVTVVSLWKTQASDAGMERLQSLTGLEELDIQATNVTDTGLKHLHELKNLKTVLLGGGSRVTRDGMRALSEALPDCSIHR